MAFTTRGIWEGGEPILLGFHDRDGTWEFLPGTTVETADGVPIHVGLVTDREPSLADLVDLPPGWGAERGSQDAPWERFEWPDAEE